MEKSMEHAIRADYGSIKQIVDEYYARKEREDDEKKAKKLRKKLKKKEEIIEKEKNKLKVAIRNLKNEGYTIEEIARLTCTECSEVKHILGL